MVKSYRNRTAKCHNLHIKKRKKVKRIEKICYKIILLTIVLLNIFIGSNIKRPIWIVQLVVSIFLVIYIITKKIQKERNIIIKGKSNNLK